MKKRLPKITHTFTLVLALSFSSASHANPMYAGVLWKICCLQQGIRFPLCQASAPATSNCHEIFQEPEEVACVNSSYYFFGICAIVLTVLAIKTCRPALHKVKTP